MLKEDPPGEEATRAEALQGLSVLDVGSSEQEVLEEVSMLRGRAEKGWVQAPEETAAQTLRGTR